MIEATNNLPGNFGTELTKRLREILKETTSSLRERDQLFLTQIANHKEAVVSIQKVVENHTKGTNERILELRFFIHDFKETSLQ